MRRLYLTIPALGVVAGVVIALLLPSPAPSSPVLRFNPDSVTRLTLTSDGRTHVAERHSDEWYLTDASTPETRWLGSNELISYAINTLSHLSLKPTDGSMQFIPGPKLTLELSDGDKHQIQFGTAPLGGRIWAQIGDAGSAVGTLDAHIAEPFEDGLMPAWAETRPFAPQPDPTEIQIQTGKAVITLIREYGQWHMREPIESLADQDIVVKAIRTLTALQSTILVDQPPSTSPAKSSISLSSPVVAQTAATDQPRRTTTLSVVGVDQSDTSSLLVTTQTRVGTDRTPSADTGTSLIAPLQALVDQELLDRISTDPTAYLSRRSAELPQGDIAAITITRSDGTRLLEAQRTIDGWTNGSVPLSGETAAMLDQLTRLICETTATHISIAPPNEPSAQASLRVQLATLSGATMGRWNVHPAPSQSGAATELAVAQGRVVRVYESDLWNQLSALPAD